MSRCPFVFGGKPCGYRVQPRGTYKECDKTVAACVARHGDAARFGGNLYGAKREWPRKYSPDMLKPGQLYHLEPGEAFVPLRTTPLPGETCARVGPNVDTRVWWAEHARRAHAAAWDRKYPEIASARMVGRPTPPRNQLFEEGAVWAPLEVPAWLRRWLLRDVRPAWLNRARDLVLRACRQPIAHSARARSARSARSHP